MTTDINPNIPHMAPASTPEFVSSTPDWLKDFIRKASEAYDIPTIILSALLKQESGFNTGVTSPVGAQGIAQMMPGTAKSLGVNPWDPESAIMGAAKYLSNAMQKFGKMDLALASYNAGTGAVQKYGGIPPYKETQNYVKNIMAMAGQDHQSANGPTIDMIQQAKKMSQPAPQTAQLAVNRPNAPTAPSAPNFPRQPAPQLPGTPNYGTVTANPSNYNPQVSQQGQLNAAAQHQDQMNHQAAQSPVYNPGYQAAKNSGQFNVPPNNPPNLGAIVGGIGNAINGAGTWVANAVGHLFGR